MHDLGSYDFFLPDSCIAHEPASPRDSSKLLVYKNDVIQDLLFSDLVSFVPANTVFILNDTRVMKARVKFLVGDKAVEIFFVEQILEDTFKVLVNPGKMFKLNFLFTLPGNVSAEVVKIDEDGFRIIKLRIEIDLISY
jgi:S-adenosylmethionine:tRNA ribosyltransferase-isomerase